jgi:hypothetical protein
MWREAFGEHQATTGYNHDAHLPSQGESNMANSEDVSDEAFAELFKLFSKPTKSPQKAFRTYQLTFESGEPVFTLSEVDRRSVGKGALLCTFNIRFRWESGHVR